MGAQVSRRLFVLSHKEARARAALCVMDAPDGYIVTVSEPTRSLDQNAMLWPLLDRVARQVEWHGQKLTADDWKNMFTSSLKKQRVVPGIDGGFVVMGQSTRVMSKAEMSELIELIMAFGAQHGVQFDEVRHENETV
jgi:hypothetical protein